MRAKLSLPFFLLPVVLLAAEDFESYPTAEAMRQVWSSMLEIHLRSGWRSAHSTERRCT